MLWALAQFMSLLYHNSLCWDFALLQKLMPNCPLNEHTTFPSCSFLPCHGPPTWSAFPPLPYYYFKWQISVYFCKECVFHSSSKHIAGNVIDFYSYSEHCVFSPLSGIPSHMLRGWPSFQGEGNEESRNQVSHSRPPSFRNGVAARPLWKHCFSRWWRLQNSLPKVKFVPSYFFW